MNNTIPVNNYHSFVTVSPISFTLNAQDFEYLVIQSELGLRDTHIVHFIINMSYVIAFRQNNNSHPVII